MADKQRVIIRNLAPWEVAFARKNMNGDVTIAPNGKIFLDEQEITAQCFSNNRLFIGTDGHGSHAQIYIESPELRQEFGFESADGKEKQVLLDDERLHKIFEYKRQADFEKAVREWVVVHYEKFKIIDYIKSAKINDYDKIRFIEEYTGVKVDN